MIIIIIIINKNISQINLKILIIICYYVYISYNIKAH